MDHESIPFGFLEKIQYLFDFSIESQKFNYTLENLGIHSDITEINVIEDRVEFRETGQIGSGVMVWKKKQLDSLIFHLDKDEKNADFNEAYSVHSLPFIKWIGKISNVLDPKDIIKFQIKNDHPFRVDIQFKKLGDSYLLYFLAPRVEEAEYEEDVGLEDF